MLDGGNGEKWEMETDIQRVAQETSCSQPTKDLTWQCCYCCCDARVGAWLVRTGRKGAWGEPTEQKQTDRQTDIEANGKPKIFKQPHINVEHISARKYIKDNGCTHRYFAMGSSRTAAMNMQVGRQEGSSKPARNIRESARTPFGFGWVKGTLVWASSSR